MDVINMAPSNSEPDESLSMMMQEGCADSLASESAETLKGRRIRQEVVNRILIVSNSMQIDERAPLPQSSVFSSKRDRSTQNGISQRNILSEGVLSAM